MRGKFEKLTDDILWEVDDLLAINEALEDRVKELEEEVSTLEEEVLDLSREIDILENLNDEE